MCGFRTISLAVECGDWQDNSCQDEGRSYLARAPHSRRPLCSQGAGETMGLQETWKADRGSCAVEIPGDSDPREALPSAQLEPARQGGQGGHNSRDLAPTTDTGAQDISRAHVSSRKQAGSAPGQSFHRIQAINYFLSHQVRGPCGNHSHPSVQILCCCLF